MSYRLDDPGTAQKSLAERFPFAQAEGVKMLQTIRMHSAAKARYQLHWEIQPDGNFWIFAGG
jgi:hypothetical protein